MKRQVHLLLIVTTILSSFAFISFSSKNHIVGAESLTCDSFPFTEETFDSLDSTIWNISTDTSSTIETIEGSLVMNAVGSDSTDARITSVDSIQGDFAIETSISNFDTSATGTAKASAEFYIESTNGYKAYISLIKENDELRVESNSSIDDVFGTSTTVVINSFDELILTHERVGSTHNVYYQVDNTSRIQLVSYTNATVSDVQLLLFAGSFTSTPDVSFNVDYINVDCTLQNITLDGYDDSFNCSNYPFLLETFDSLISNRWNQFVDADSTLEINSSRLDFFIPSSDDSIDGQFSRIESVGTLTGDYAVSADITSFVSESSTNSKATAEFYIESQNGDRYYISLASLSGELTIRTNGLVNGVFGSEVSTTSISENFDVITFAFEKISSVLNVYYQIDNNERVLLKSYTEVANSNTKLTFFAGSFEEAPEVSFTLDNINIGCNLIAARPVISDGSTPIYRFFNKQNGAHLYTISTNERDTIKTTLSDLWQYEGEKFKVFENQVEGTVPVYRFFNTKTGAHLYSINDTEVSNVLNNLAEFNYEGIKFYVYGTEVEESINVYRFFNTENGAHIYTISDQEFDTIRTTLPNFDSEGIKFYVKNL